MTNKLYSFSYLTSMRRFTRITLTTSLTIIKRYVSKKPPGGIIPPVLGKGKNTPKPFSVKTTSSTQPSQKDLHKSFSKKTKDPFPAVKTDNNAKKTTSTFCANNKNGKNTTTSWNITVEKIKRSTMTQADSTKVHLSADVINKMTSMPTPPAPSLPTTTVTSSTTPPLPSSTSPSKPLPSTSMSTPVLMLPSPPSTEPPAESNIPSAPPIPTTLPVQKYNSTTKEYTPLQSKVKSAPDNNTTSFTEQIKNTASTLKQLKSDTIPLPVPSTVSTTSTNTNTATSITMKNASGVDYTTNIKPDTTVFDLTPEQLIHELKIRGLVADNPKATIAQFVTEDDKIVTIGDAKYGVKATPLARGYIEKYQSPNIFELENPLNQLDFANIQYKIVIPPMASKTTIVEDGAIKHLIITFDNKNNQYASGYLTSKKGPDLLCSINYKTFVNKLKSNDEPTSNKEQYLVIYDNAKQIPDNFIIQTSKLSAQYLKVVNQSTLYKMYEKQRKAPIEIIDKEKDGITMHDGLMIIKDFDKTIQSGGKHPISKEQILLNQLNHEKQKQANIDKKSKANEYNKNKPSDNQTN